MAASPQPKILFASRRWTPEDGSTNITLIIPKTGERYEVEEGVLRSERDCGLGDFLSWTGDKLEKFLYFKSAVVGDIAYVDGILTKLVNVDGTQVFETDSFGKVICRKYLPLGQYAIRVNVLITSHKLPSGEEIHFESSNEVYTSPRPANVAPIVPMGGRYSPAQSLVPTPILSGGGSGSGSRPATPVGNNGIVKGAGFQKKHIPKKQSNPNEKKVVGGGFPVNKEEKPDKKVIVGAGFEPPKKEGKVVVGTGFEVQVQKSFKLRAVVLSVMENARSGMRTYYLWVLDRQTEGRFVSKDYDLRQGHFFEGTFKENQPNKWNCEKYEKAVEKPAGIDGGIDFDGKIWFAVSVNNFQPAGGNRRFGKVNARHFGEIVEGELESTKLSAASNGKQVKIQRKGVGEGDYVWMVTEII